MRKLFFALSLMVMAFACSSDNGPVYEFPDNSSGQEGDNEGGGDSEGEDPVEKHKTCYLWVDAAANFPDFANDVDAIARDLKKAKDAGFTDVIIDVRPTTGDVLFRTSHCDQVKWLGAWTSEGYSKIERTAKWDYLEAFIEEGHKLGLRVHASFNTMVGGNASSLGREGVLFRDSSKKGWATVLNTTSGFINTLDANSNGTMFLNPADKDVQEYLCSLLKDLAAYKGLDGIILDRCRFDSMQSDFSEKTRSEFEKYVGQSVNFYEDVLPVGHNGVVNSSMTSQRKYLKLWLEFRAKTIHDFMKKAREAVKGVNPQVKFGAYVGGWYSTYYDVGVNWASPQYNTASDFPVWATAKYKDMGYADMMDHMMIGAYASPGNVYGSSEWTMQGFCSLAMKRIKGSCPLVCGGPDVGNWDYDDKYSDKQERDAVINSVEACGNACNGYFLFDMIHLKKQGMWAEAKLGISKYNK